MAKNEVSIFDAGQVPDHIASFNQEESNIVARNAADRLSIKGKVFTVILNGNKQTLMKKNEDGDDEPRPTIPVVVLGYAARRGRAYYPDGYTDGTPKPPTCWSKDGITPDKEVEEKQAAKCAECEMSKKGSKVSEDGRETKACGEHRFAAIQLYRRWDMPPIQLRLAITSDYDTRNKEQEAKGWYAFSQFMDMLRARGVKHTASVVTRIKFDHLAPMPKLLFSAVGWLTPEELEIVSPLAKSDEVQSLINPVFTVGTGEGGAATPKEDPEEDEPELTKPAATKPPKPGVKATTPSAAAKTTKPTTATGKTKPKPAPEPEAEDGEDEELAEDAVDGEVVDEGGEDATDVTGIVEAAEDEEDEEAAALAAAAKVRADIKAKKDAKAKAEQEAAKKAASARKSQPAEDDEDAEDDSKITVSAPTKPKVTATAGKATGGKPPAPKGTPAGKPTKVAEAVGTIIDEW